MIVSNVSNTKNNLSELLRKVQQGEVVTIVDRDRPVARMIAISKDEEHDGESVAARAVRLGLATAAERRMRELPPLRGDDAPISLLDCLLADREEARY